MVCGLCVTLVRTNLPGTKTWSSCRLSTTRRPHVVPRLGASVHAHPSAAAVEPVWSYGGQMSEEVTWARARDARRERTGCPPWRGFSAACIIVLCGVTARTALPVALVVGTLLSAVNQGAVIAGGGGTPGRVAAGQLQLRSSVRGVQHGIPGCWSVASGQCHPGGRGPLLVGDGRLRDPPRSVSTGLRRVRVPVGMGSAEAALEDCEGQQECDPDGEEESAEEPPGHTRAHLALKPGPQDRTENRSGHGPDDEVPRDGR